MKQTTRATTLWDGKSASIVPTIYYPKCPLFNKKWWDIKRNRKMWPIHTGKNQKVETALKGPDGALSRRGLQSLDYLLFPFFQGDGAEEFGPVCLDQHDHHPDMIQETNKRRRTKVESRQTESPGPRERHAIDFSGFLSALYILDLKKLETQKY